MLFSDIEGSTALLRRLGEDDYAGLLALHHRLVRAALSSHGGREVNNEGDGFFSLLASASEAMAAAAHIQRDLVAADWPAGAEVRVRMGVHVGEAAEHEAAGLVGLAVHRAARIAAVAHGGQVLCSEVAAALGRDRMPDGLSLRDLGLHRLRDLGAPERLFQLEGAGLGADFPPLRSLDNPELRHNLPAYLSSFVGRAAELAEVRALVERHRLVTLTGAGGAGKTRLALHVAADLLDGSGEGVWFVDLSVLSDPAQLPAAVLAALGLPAPAEGGGEDRLLAAVREQRLLLVLDNCEHLVDACAKLADRLLRSCPSVHLVATSREPLGIDGERVHRVRPLALPEDGAAPGELAACEAVQLFVERARERDDRFEPDDEDLALVAGICRRLDGVPFAVELAAARLTSMSLADLAARLDQRFRLLTGGRRTALARQRTLQATLDWSYDLLSAAERQVLALLAVFAGSFDLDAAEAVCAPVLGSPFELADLLDSLVNKSLVVAERSGATGGASRYRLLETTRQYGADRLAAREGGLDALGARRAHAEHYLAVAELAGEELVGARQSERLRVLDLEWDNVREALAHLHLLGRDEAVLRMAWGISRYLWTRGSSELVPILRDVLGRAASVPVRLRARGTLVCANLLALEGMFERRSMHETSELTHAAAALARQAGDDVLLAEALCWESMALTFLGELDTAGALAEEALERATAAGSERLAGTARMCQGVAACRSNDPERATAHFVEAIAALRSAGDLLVLAMTINNSLAAEPTAALAARRADIAEATELGESLGFAFLVRNGNLTLGELAAREGDAAGAHAHLRHALQARDGDLRLLSAALWLGAHAWCLDGDLGRAAELLGAYAALLERLRSEAPAGALSASDEEDEDLERLSGQLRDALGAEELARRLRAGSRLSLREACDLALGRRQPAA